MWASWTKECVEVFKQELACEIAQHAFAKAREAFYLKLQYSPKYPKLDYLLLEESSLSFWGTKKLLNFWVLISHKDIFEKAIDFFAIFTLKKFTPFISAFMSVHPFSLSYTFTNKSFTFSGKKATIGCLSKHLDNCICIFLYEGCLLNYTICLFLVHNLHQVAWSVVMVKEKYGLEVGNSCQISNVLHNIYITWVRLNS